MTVVPYIIDFLDFKVASLTKLSKNFPANVYLFKVNNKNTRTTSAGLSCEKQNSFLYYIRPVAVMIYLK